MGVGVRGAPCELVDAAELPGYLATLGGRRVGLAMVAIKDREYEVVAISTTEPRRGIGRALMVGCVAEARTGGADACG